MRRGRPKKPTISVESIEATLKTLGHHASEVPEVVALQHLALVDLYLENPSRPPTEDIRGWALRSLLVKTITEALSEQRRFFDLPLASSREKRRTAFECIQQDSLQNSHVLLGWSILFYRYVRADLAITTQELADYVNVHQRTIRRERHDAILRLRDRLADAEWKARQMNQRRMLRANIPEKQVKLLERDSEMNLILNRLKDNQATHFFVTGATGIGKSAFAAAVAHQLIDENALDFIIWLSKPQHVMDVKNAVHDALLPYPSEAEMNALLLEYRTLVVIDDATSLIMKHEEWLDLLRYLNHAIVLVCHREHVLFPHPIIHIPIRELSEFGIYELIKTYPLAETITETLQKQIWENVGGNPRSVDYALRQIANGNRIQFGALALRSIYHNLFEQLDNDFRGLWILLATLPNGIHVGNLNFLIGSDNRLFDYGLIELLDSDGQMLQFVPSARYYIETIIASDKALAILAIEKLKAILGGKSFPLPRTVSDVFLEILECSWLEIDVRAAFAVLSGLDTRILTIPQLRKWWQQITVYDVEPSLELLLLKGIAARRLHYYDEAFLILDHIIQQTGQIGEFVQQSVARYELAVLYQSRAEFDRAIHVYRELESYPVQTANQSLMVQIKRQQARIAIEKRNAEIAVRYLESYPRVIQDEILLCEALLIRGDGEACREQAEIHLQDVQEEPLLASSLYTIIGRSYAQDGRIDEAIGYLNATLALTERFNTDFDIARAQCNLASVYLQLDEEQSLDYAGQLLGQAQSTQMLIVDTVGLLITERNLQHLNILRLNR